MGRLLAGIFKTIGILALIFIAGVGLLFAFIYEEVIDTPYQIDKVGLTDVEIDSQGEYIYASYFRENAVVKMSASTLAEAGRFAVTNPTLMVMSPDDKYLYVLSYYWGGRLTRITLKSGITERVVLNQGHPIGLAIDPSGDRLWVCCAIWPKPFEWYSNDDAWDNPDSGRVIEIDTSNLRKARITTVNAAPVSVWYSAYSNQLYVLHDIPCSPETEPNQELCDRPTLAPVAVYNPQTMEEITEFYAGGDDIIRFPHVQMTNWDDDGRYLCIPSPFGRSSGFSMRVIDTTTNTVAFDLSLLDNYGNQIGFQFAHKLPGSDYLWTLTCSGIHDWNLEGQGGTAARINTLTREYEFFFIEGWTKFTGDFAIAPDDETLYIPEISTGTLFVWSPE